LIGFDGVDFYAAAQKALLARKNIYLQTAEFNTENYVDKKSTFYQFKPKKKEESSKCLFLFSLECET
jgi:hypothetical protein